MDNEEVQLKFRFTWEEYVAVYMAVLTRKNKSWLDAEDLKHLESAYKKLNDLVSA